MGIDVADTVKSTFGSLNTATGLKVIGLLFVIQLANMLSTTLYTAGTAAALLGGVVTVLSVIAALFVAVGALRSLDSGSFRKEQYLEHVTWPATRLIGANLVTGLFAYGIGALIALPIAAIASLTGMGVVTTGSLLGTVLTAVALGLGAAAFVFILLTLVASLPMVATGDRRMFEALDLSVQRTHGNRNSMFLALLPVIALYIAGALIMVMAPLQGTYTALAGAVSALIGSVVAVAFLSLLTEYDQRLPEA